MHLYLFHKYGRAFLPVRVSFHELRIICNSDEACLETLNFIFLLLITYLLLCAEGFLHLFRTLLGHIMSAHTGVKNASLQQLLRMSALHEKVMEIFDSHISEIKICSSKH